MTASLAPVDTQTLAALRSGDEHALESIFRERYPVLLPEATQALDGDAACGARVVERAHLHLWNERATVGSAARVDDLLREGVHQGTVRERSRRAAAHRLVEHEGGLVRPKAAAPAPSVDEAWHHLSARLHPTAADAEVARERAERSRHEAAHHIAEVEKERSATPIVLGVLGGLAAVALLIWALDSVEPTASLARALSAPEATPYESARGQRARIGLPGFDALVLGSESRLVVPPRFDDLRGVGLEGTAMVNLAEGQRLIVETPAGRVSSTGGVFAVSARPAEPMVVRVDSGTATLAPTGGEAVELTAGQSMVVAGGAAPSAASREQADESLAWTGDSLIVADRPLREVLPQLGRWYALDLSVADSALLDRPVTMRAGLGSSRDAISALESAAGVSVRNVDRRLVIVDAVAVPSGRPAGQAVRRPTT